VASPSHQFTGLDLLNVVEAPCRAWGHEEGVTVAFELGTLMSGQGDLDCARMRREQACGGNAPPDRPVPEPRATNGTPASA
jgi:hypothetical protein